jgi:hypothetical protein
MIRKISLIFMLLLTFLPVMAQASYFSDMQHTLVRGVKNVLGHPLEIPITIQEYHESAGYPGIRHLAGLTDGLFQALARLGSGIWDILPASVIPGIQEGLPVQPETLF